MGVLGKLQGQQSYYYYYKTHRVLGLIPSTADKYINKQIK
jgi:hypothetical protein